MFWNGGTGNWQTSASWYGGIKPGAANAAVIDTGTVSIVNAGETAEYTFVAGTGTLNLRNNLATSYLIIRDIFPDWAADVGLIGRGIPYRILRRVAGNMAGEGVLSQPNRGPEPIGPARRGIGP